MISLQEALATVLGHTDPLPPEPCAPSEALGRWLAGELLGTRTEPAADNSAMDGYAVRAADTAGAPVTLQLTGRSRAGSPFDAVVGPGEAARIFTGALLPAGADSVVMQEYTEQSEDGASIRILEPASHGQHVRRAGCELRPGDRLLDAGDPVTPAVLGLLARGGVHDVEVHRRPRVAVAGTGDELVDPEKPEIAPHEVVDGNGPMLRALCEQAGAEVLCTDRLRDDTEAVAAWLARAVDHADLILTTGGASVGEHDVIADAWGLANIETVFWKVAMKPGKPQRFGVRAKPAGGKVLVLALPGNPLSALTGFEQLALPALVKLSGGPARPWPRLRLPLADDVRAAGQRLGLIRGGPSSEGDLPRLAVPPRQQSHMLAEAARQPLIGVLPAGRRSYEAGALVEAVAPPGGLDGLSLRHAPPLPALVALRGGTSQLRGELISATARALGELGLRSGAVCREETEMPAGPQGLCREISLREQGSWTLHDGGEKLPEPHEVLELFAGSTDLLFWQDGCPLTCLTIEIVASADGTISLDETPAGTAPGGWLLALPEGAPPPRSLIARLASSLSNLPRRPDPV